MITKDQLITALTTNIMKTLPISILPPAALISSVNTPITMVVMCSPVPLVWAPMPLWHRITLINGGFTPRISRINLCNHFRWLI